MKLTATPSDEALLRQMMAGDANAFEQLYDRRQAGIYQYALRMSGSHTLAEDVVQDVFIEFLRDANLFDSSRGTVVGYLFGMARHRVLRRLERERKYVSLIAEEQKEEMRSSGVPDGFVAETDPLTDIERSETVEAVRQAVLRLPEHYREVVVLCSLHEMSYEQASEIIGCPVGTVRSRLSRARIMLIEKLQLLRLTGVAFAQSARTRSEV